MTGPIVVKTSPYVVGIDLGTSNSSASIYQKGMAVTIPIESGDKSVPSVVQFKGKKKEQMMVGKAAKKSVLINPDEVFTSVKRLMKNDDWKNDDDLVKKFTLTDNDGNDVQITPTEVGTEILKLLMDKVQLQDAVDLQGTVRSAVICVPANTTDEYRQNVYKASALADLGEVDDNNNVVLDDKGFPKGVFLLEEPTAAAIAYAHEQGIFSSEKEQTILVYDLGGGTFDVTILDVDSTQNPERPKIAVKATKGVSKLGGDDFDKVIMDMCAEEFKAVSGIDIYDLKSDQRATSPKVLKKAQQKLKEEAERVKINFAGGSKKEEMIIPEFLKDGDGGKHSLELEIKKSDFVSKITPLLDQAKACVTDSLKEAKLELADINRIILVGGSTKGDWVMDSIKGLYPSGEERDPYRAKNVDIIVSQGAAIYGASKPVESGGLKGKEDTLDSTVESIISHHMGIEVEGGVFGLVLEKGLPLNDDTPVQTATRVYGNQDSRDTLQIVLWKTQKTIDFEGDNGDRKPKEKHFVSEKDDQGEKVFECIGEFALKGVPKAPRGTEKIEITMDINKENLLKVGAKVLSKGTGEEIELDVSKS